MRKLAWNAAQIETYILHQPLAISNIRSLGQHDDFFTRRKFVEADLEWQACVRVTLWES
ncbi:hypothetical protein D3C86_2174150 [compost metagenome]